GYVGSYAVTSFVAGAAADRIGHLPVFRAGLGLSAAAFALCGWAPSFGLLVAGRAVQGIAGGLVYGTSPALVTLGAAAPLRGRRAARGGGLCWRPPLGTGAGGARAGRLADRGGARPPMVAGLVLEAIGLGVMSRVEAATPLALVALALCAAGFGLGVFQVPNMVSVMAAFPAHHQGAAGGLTFLARTLGVVTGVAILAAV